MVCGKSYGGRVVNGHPKADPRRAPHRKRTDRAEQVPGKGPLLMSRNNPGRDWRGCRQRASGSRATTGDEILGFEPGQDAQRLGSGEKRTQKIQDFESLTMDRLDDAFTR